MQNINEGLLYDGMLPLAIRSVPALPSENQLAMINASNESLLKASLILHDSPEIDEHDELSQELRRQDYKINLLLEMVGELLAHQNILPAPIQLSLTSSHLDCQYTNPDFSQTLGEVVEISLYITPNTPKALTLFGHVMKTGIECSIQFMGINQSVQDWLEKVIFRHHRRTIAQSLHTK